MIKKFKYIEKGKVVSSLMLYTVKLPSRYLAVIEEVFTKKEFRKQGKASCLMLEAIEYADKLGCTCIELTVRQDQPKVQKWYGKFGFKSRKNLSFRLNLNYK